MPLFPVLLFSLMPNTFIVLNVTVSLDDGLITNHGNSLSGYWLQLLSIQFEPLFTLDGPVFLIADLVFMCEKYLCPLA